MAGETNQTTQDQLRAALPQASSVVIVLRIGDREQQFDGAWLRETLPGGAAAEAQSALPADGEPRA